MKNLAIALVLGLALTSCGKAKMQAHTPSVTNIKGNPMAFVAGRRLHPSSTIPASAIDVSATYQVNIDQIRNRIEPSGQPFNQSQAPENTGLQMGDAQNVFYLFHKKGAESYRLAPFTVQGLEFEFTEKNGFLELSVMRHGDNKWVPNQTDFKILNYSTSPDGALSSILIYFQTAKEENLTTIYFSKVAEPKVKLVRSDAPYNYMLGRGVKVTWPSSEPLKVLYCGPASPEHLLSDFKNMVREWNYVLQGRLQLEVESPSTACPPFSDVNTRTFGFVDAWIEDPQLESGTLGVTFMQTNLESSRFFDGDIFVLSQEFTDIYRYQRQNVNFYGSTEQAPQDFKALYSRVALHELGHLLGLHHIFDGTLSVMSYQSIHGLMAYDREGVQTLYPAKPVSLMDVMPHLTWPETSSSK